MLQSAIKYTQVNNSRYLKQLVEFLKIPSISTLSQYRNEIWKAAAFLAEELNRIGLQGQIYETDGHPIVYGEWLGAGVDALTLLVYGHYDVQPPGDLSLWDSDPFAPTVRNGRLYARGASDNKAQHFSHIKAVESMLMANGRLPVNVKFCLDGEEEIGSPTIASFVATHKDLLAADLVVVSDGGMISPDQPTIDYALRGMVTAELTVTGPARDLHSGGFGGTVHNPIQALTEICAALHDEHGQVTIPGFYEDVLVLTAAERELLQRVPYGLENWRAETGAPQPWGEPDYSLFERMTARPTCEINGIWGGFTGEGFRTIIPPTAHAKVSMRLVAAQDPQKIAAQFAAFVEQLAPPTVSVTVDVLAGAAAAVTAYDSPAITAAVRAYEAGWGAAPVLSRGGGSLPIIATFQKELGTPFVLMPFGLDDNRHAPNEHYHLAHFERGIITAIYLYAYLADSAAS